MSLIREEWTPEDLEMAARIVASFKNAPVQPRRFIPSVESPPDVLSTAKDVIEVGYKALAMERHPDHGGTHEDMQALNSARDWLRAAIAKVS